MALLDAIRRRLAAGPAQAPAPSAAATQQALQQTLATAATGKARAPGGPAASTVGAEAVAAQGAQQMGALNLAGQQAAAQLGAAESQQTQQADLARQQVQTQTEQGMKDIAAQQAEAGAGRQAARDIFGTQADSKERQTIAGISASAQQALSRLASDRGVAEADIWASFKQGNQDLAFRKDAAQLEQAAFTMALADKAYIENLQQIGQVRRLENEVNFKKELNSMILDEETKQLLTQFDWARLDQADDREWTEAMSKIDLDSAMAIATSKVKTAAATQYVQGFSSIAQAGVKADWGGEEGGGDGETPDHSLIRQRGGTPGIQTDTSGTSSYNQA